MTAGNFEDETGSRKYLKYILPEWRLGIVKTKQAQRKYILPEWWPGILKTKWAQRKYILSEWQLGILKTKRTQSTCKYILPEWRPGILKTKRAQRAHVNIWNIFYLNDGRELWRRNRLNVNIFYLNDGREFWRRNRLMYKYILPEWRLELSQDKTQQLNCLGNRNK